MLARACRELLRVFCADCYCAAGYRDTYTATRQKIELEESRVYSPLQVTRAVRTTQLRPIAEQYFEQFVLPALVQELIIYILVPCSMSVYRIYPSLYDTQYIPSLYDTQYIPSCTMFTVYRTGRGMYCVSYDALNGAGSRLAPRGLPWRQPTTGSRRWRRSAEWRHDHRYTRQWWVTGRVRSRVLSRQTPRLQGARRTGAAAGSDRPHVLPALLCTLA